jgi:hypothetical protein
MILMRKIFLSVVLTFLVLNLLFPSSVLAGFHRDLENGLKSDFPSGYTKAPQAYKVGDTFEARDRLFNTTNHNITDNYWLEIWKVERCEQPGDTITVTGDTPGLTEDKLDKCSGGTLDRVARTQTRIFAQAKYLVTIRSGNSFILSGDWVIDRDGYFQFDFFSDSTWSHGPFATGFFRATGNPSPTPKPSPLPSRSPSPAPSVVSSPAPTPLTSVSPVPIASTQPSSGGEFWIFGGLFVLVILSGGAIVYLLVKTPKLLKLKRQAKKRRHKRKRARK